MSFGNLLLVSHHPQDIITDFLYMLMECFLQQGTLYFDSVVDGRTGRTGRTGQTRRTGRTGRDGTGRTGRMDGLDFLDNLDVLDYLDNP